MIVKHVKQKVNVQESNDKKLQVKLSDIRRD